MEKLIMSCCWNSTILFPWYDVSALFLVVICEGWVDIARMSRVLSLTDFINVMCRSRSLSVRIRLILKSTYGIEITRGHKVLALKLMSIAWLLCMSSDILSPLRSHSSSMRSLRLWNKNYCFTKWRFNAENTFIMHSNLSSANGLSFLILKWVKGLLVFWTF